MMSVKKMLIGGAAAFVTVSLIGCKDDGDDDDNACEGFALSYTNTPTGDCLECVAENGWGNSPDYRSMNAAVVACGGESASLPSGIALCDDVAIADQNDLDTNPACGICMAAWDSRLGAQVDVNSEYAEPAFVACGGDAADWTVSS